MSELTIKVRPAQGGPNVHYQDSDIVSAKSDRHILCSKAEEICDHRKVAKNANGLRLDSLAKRFQRLVYQYEFRRVAEQVVERETIASGVVDLMTPDNENEHLRTDAEIFVNARLAHDAHRIFGNEAINAIWYGGHSDLTRANVDRMWDLIEGERPERRTDQAIRLWAVHEREFSRFLCIAVDDFDESLESRLVETEIDFDELQPEFNLDLKTLLPPEKVPPEFEIIGNPPVSVRVREDPIGFQLVRKRRAFIEWRNLPRIPTIGQVLDRNILIDWRETIHPLAVVQYKPYINTWTVPSPRR